MMRLAFGAKCGLPKMGWPDSGSLPRADKSEGFKIEPSAAAPIPTALRPKKCRRVIRRLRSRNGSIKVIRLCLGHSFVEVQEHGGNRRKGSEFAFVQARMRLKRSDLQELFRVLLVLLEGGQLLLINFH